MYSYNFPLSRRVEIALRENQQFAIPWGAGSSPVVNVDFHWRIRGGYRGYIKLVPPECAPDDTLNIPYPGATTNFFSTP
jgi:hypothetical protein